MLTLAWLGILLATTLTLAFVQLKPWAWIGIFAAVLLVWTTLTSSLWQPLIWLVFIGLALVTTVPQLRRRWLAQPFYKRFLTRLPQLSDADQVAIESGTVNWARQLFSGRPQWNLLETNQAAEQLTDQETAFIDGPVQKLLDQAIEQHPLTYDDLKPYNTLWQLLVAEGFFGLNIQQQYGGLEFSAQAQTAILAKIASAPGGPSLAPIIATANALGPAQLIQRFGSEQQKQHYLPQLASGQLIPCLAVTSSSAGTDAASIIDAAEVCQQEHNGKTQTVLRVRWSKRHIMLAPVANLLGLAVRVYDPEHLLGDAEDLGITCLLVDANQPGISRQIQQPIGAVFPYGSCQGQDVIVPLDQVIGGKEQIGNGWSMLMACHANTRAMMTPALAAGTSTRMARLTSAYCRVRQQFGRQIGRFEGVEEALAHIGGQAYANEAVRRLIAKAVDRGEQPAIAAAIAKYHTSVNAQNAVNQSMSLMAGKAIATGPSNPFTEHYLAAPIVSAIDGPNIFTRSMQIFGQGAMRCHPLLAKEIQAAQQDEQAALDAFTQLAPAHLAHIASVTARSFVLGLTNGRGSKMGLIADLKPFYRRFNRYAASFALVSELAMATLGDNLRHRESVTTSLGDIFSQLYIISAALHRYQQDGSHRQDLPAVKWVCEYGFQVIETSLIHALQYLPKRGRAWLVRRIIFPLGRRSHGPKDHTRQQLATMLQTPGETRDRLTANCFLPTTAVRDVRLFDAALQAAFDSGSLRKRLHRAIKRGDIKPKQASFSLTATQASGLLSDEELELLQTAKVLHDAVVQVDCYDDI